MLHGNYFGERDLHSKSENFFIIYVQPTTGGGQRQLGRESTAPVRDALCPPFFLGLLQVFFFWRAS
jgi:hypothetical protein